MFHDQIEWNMEVYIDNMLVKSQQKMNHLTDLQETFNTFQKYNIKLNPSNCVFAMHLKSFLALWCHKEG